MELSKRKVNNQIYFNIIVEADSSHHRVQIPIWAFTDYCLGSGTPGEVALGLRVTTASAEPEVLSKDIPARPKTCGEQMDSARGGWSGFGVGNDHDG